jgi:UDP-glucuronate 4-epimerase
VGLVTTVPAERVLVTGAAGFIGSHLCELLGGQGRQVAGVDNFDPYYGRAEKTNNVRCLELAGATFSEGDICDYDAFSALVERVNPEVIVHLAAKAGVRNSVEHPRDYFVANLQGTQNVLDVCRENDIERLVAASTSSVYGHTKILPFQEDDPCIAPLHPYAATKRSGELLAGTYAHLYGLQATMLRFFTVYGPRGRPDMMPRLLLDSISNQTPVPLFEGPLERDWTYVADIVDGIAAAVDHPLGFETLNLGRGAPLPLAEFIDELHRVSGGKANLVPKPRPASEMMSTYASTERLQDRLGIRPSVTVAEGVQDLWEWWQASRPAGF